MCTRFQYHCSLKHVYTVPISLFTKTCVHGSNSKSRKSTQRIIILSTDMWFNKYLTYLNGLSCLQPINWGLDKKSSVLRFFFSTENKQKYRKQNRWRSSSFFFIKLVNKMCNLWFCCLWNVLLRNVLLWNVLLWKWNDLL